MTNSAPAGDATTTGPRIAEGLPAVTTIAGQIMDRFILTSPLTTTLPLAMLRRDVVAMASACSKVAADLLNGVDYRKPLADVRACAMGWAHAGVSVEAIQHAVHEGLILAFDHVATRDRSGAESVPVAEVARMFVEIANRIALAISEAYLDEIRSSRRESIDALASAVMAGTATAAMARDYGVPLAENYLVFAIEIGAQGDESDPRLDPRIIAHRKLRRVRAEISRWCGDGALMSLTSRGGTLLIPEARLDTTDAEWFVEAISAAAQAPVRATFLPATIDSIPETVEHVDAMLHIIRRMRRVGLHHFGDLYLEYQLTRPGAARDRLAAVLDPLDEQPVLLQTLLTHLETEAARLRTAKALHMHPNTVDYRLERIAEVTGLDPRNPEGLWRLRSAAIARLAGDISENPEPHHEGSTEVAAQAC
ncbi:PucR family transcriptional regulator [Nocardia cyriacigeorgica]|uniref:PucR family transcriptional regulator n=1 Tax=Nocardia cyriacigeorgica TaxID=135487 RepID=UPI00248FF674|nr:helix-turn-helix domain-containing protein [Nocardia cyriacigeorgica]BDU05112.1 transcriptional regulator [Nocardia cyriacigeorgica]